jgi:hypothetical protein
MATYRMDAVLDADYRAGPAPTADELGSSYLESVRRHHEAIRRRNRALWFAYFCGQARAHAALAADYECRAEALCEEGAA